MLHTSLYTVDSTKTDLDDMVCDHVIVPVPLLIHMPQHVNLLHLPVQSRGEERRGEEREGEGRGKGRGE